MESINSTDAKKSFSDVVFKIQQALSFEREGIENCATKGFDSLNSGLVIDWQYGINTLLNAIDNA